MSANISGHWQMKTSNLSLSIKPPGSVAHLRTSDGNGSNYPVGRGIEMPTPQQWLPDSLGILELPLLGDFPMLIWRLNTGRIRYDVQTTKTS